MQPRPTSDVILAHAHPHGAVVASVGSWCRATNAMRERDDWNGPAEVAKFVQSTLTSARWTQFVVWGILRPMGFDWRGCVILMKFAEGYTYREAATSAGISKQAVLKRMNTSEEFREAVTAAREAGREERAYRAWLYHPRRGLRPPTGKGHGGTPRFAYGRR